MAEAIELFITEKAALMGALSGVKDAVDHSATIPILSHVLIAARGDAAISVTGSNLDQEITATCAAEGAASLDGVAVPAKILTDIVRNSPDGMNISVLGIKRGNAWSDIEIRSGRSRARIPVLPASDFPSLDKGDLPHALSLNAATFAKALKTVSFAAETNQQRFAYCGVHLDPVEDGLAVVASDGNRLAKRVIPLIEFDQEISGTPAITIPNAAIPSIIRMLDKQEDVTLGISDDKIRVEAGGMVLISKLLDGTFLPYKKLAISKTGVTVAFSAQALSSSISRVLAVSSDKKFGVAFDFLQDRVRLFTRDNSMGEAHDEVEAKADGSMRQGFNGKSLKDALEHLDRDEVELVVGDGKEPAFLHSPGDPLSSMMLGPMRMLWGGFSDGEGATGQ